MEAVISRGKERVKMPYQESEIKESFRDLIIILLGHHKYISPEAALTKLNLLEEMYEDFLEKSRPIIKKEWGLVKRRIKRFRHCLEHYTRDSNPKSVIWDFIMSLDGNGNLNGFGFCDGTFKDFIAGNAEKLSLYELKKRTPL